MLSFALMIVQQDEIYGQNIEPTKSRASLIVQKGADHRVTGVQLRRL